MRNHTDPTTTYIPSSRAYERGKFGRMFPFLPPCLDDTPTVRNELLLLAKSMFGPDVENPSIPAGYTYLGQFVIHDLSFDPTSINERQIDPEFLWNFRTPALDLDSLYGGGPSVTPHFYDPDIDHGATSFLLDTREVEFGIPGTIWDVQRNSKEIAIIADPRNDENILVSQIHVVFQLFHNTLVERFRSKTSNPTELFNKAQRMVRWCYQWIILYDYLPRIVNLEASLTEAELEIINQLNPRTIIVNTEDSATVEGLGIIAPTAIANTDVSSSDAGFEVTSEEEEREEAIRMTAQMQIQALAHSHISRKFYDWRNEPFIPLEFSAAAFRFGHSQVLTSYAFGGNNTASLFNGFAVKNRVPKTSIAWNMFFQHKGETIQPSNSINTNISSIMGSMPIFPTGETNTTPDILSNWLSELQTALDILATDPVDSAELMSLLSNIHSTLSDFILKIQSGNDIPVEIVQLCNNIIKVSEQNIASRNLIRGLMLKLPSGQSVARAIGLNEEDIAKLNALNIPERFKENTPLWYFILHEAGEAPNNGKRLGAVGSRIVAEVITGVLAGDKSSFINQYPNWQPALPDANGKEEKKNLTMAGLLDYLGILENNLINS